MSASAIIPAYQAAARVGETVRAARLIPGVAEVVVVDDGSTDGTGDAARRAGADKVLTLPANRGKGAALTAGIAAASRRRLLFLDADLGSSAAGAGPLLEAVATDGGDAMSVAVLPARPGSGGLGLAMGLARATIRLLAGLRLTAPMSGQRAISAALARHVGIAPAFAVEVGLTVEAAHLGVSVGEIPLALDHSPTGRTLAGFVHRGRQFRDILRFLLLTGYGLWWPSLSRASALARGGLLCLCLAAVIGLGATAQGASQTIAISAGASLALWLPMLWVTAVWLGLRRPNYLGRPLPAGAGLLFSVIAVPAIAMSPLAGPVIWSGLLTAGVFALLGLADDLLSRGHQARGLSGHLRALLRGRVTTGIIKAAGGLAVGVAAGLLLDGARPWQVALDALVIALTANFVNLLDLRPGRALKGFALLCVLPLAISPTEWHLLGPLLVAAVVSAPADLAGRTMMGDVGSNALGAAAGLGFVLALGPWDRLALVLLLIAVHIVCERWSLTEVISHNRLLAFLDRLGTAHLAPLPAAGAAERR